MPLLHCNNCHYEWEGNSNSKCDWCGSSGYSIELQTSLERCIESWKEIGDNLKEAINLENTYSKLVK
jgi:hypothetical protein